jgi:tetratricopeptide (TPR) repeat protein
MIKLLQLIGFLSVFAMNLTGQNEIDSLLNIVNKSSEAEKASALLQLSDIYLGINLDSSLDYASQMLEISKKLNDNENQGQALKKIGIVYYYGGMVDSALVFLTQSLEMFKQTDNISQQANLINSIGIIISDKGDYNKSLDHYQQAKMLYESVNDSAGIAGVLGNIGSIYLNVGSYEKALDYFTQSHELATKCNDEFSVMSSTNNIGMVYHYWGKFEEAVKYYHKSLDYSEEQGDKRTAAQINMNIGIIYCDWGKYSKAIDYYKKSEHIQQELNDVNNLINTNNNIAIVYENMDSLNKALDYYNKALHISTEIGRKRAIARANLNLGVFYSKRKEYHKSIRHYKNALDIREEIGDLHGIATALLGIGQVYCFLGEYQKGVEQFHKSLPILNELGALDQLKENYAALADVHGKLGNYRKAYDYMLQYSETKDSLYNENTHQQLTDIQTKYETEQKEKEILILNKDNQLKALKVKEQNEAIAKQRIAIIAFVVVFLIIIIFSVIVYRLYNRIKNANQKLAMQNAEIIEQKEEIQTQNNEIFAKNEVLKNQNDEISSQRDEIEAQRDLVVYQKDQIEQIFDELSQSIDYAKQIQTSILPEVSILNEQGIENFILFKPKDRVSGDFYWWTTLNEFTVITVSDCTGHGVPGAFMSFLGISFLNEIVTKEYITHPGVILRKLRKDIIKTLAQTGEEGTHKDGMDMSLLIVNHKENTISWAGANNPLWIIRANDTKEYEDLAEKIEEIKPDKMPIGIYRRMDMFTAHDLQLHKDDRVYMFSDGYADQFGGPGGKKFKSRAFKRLLAQTANLTIAEQGEVIEKTLSNWMRWEGGIYQQVDDITVFGAIIKNR